MTMTSLSRWIHPERVEWEPYFRPENWVHEQVIAKNHFARPMTDYVEVLRISVNERAVDGKVLQISVHHFAQRSCCGTEAGCWFSENTLQIHTHAHHEDCTCNNGLHGSHRT